MLALTPIWALYYALKAPIERCHDSFISRVLVAALACSGPMARTFSRYQWRMKEAARMNDLQPPRQRPSIRWLKRAVYLAYWNENGLTRDALLERLGRLLSRADCPALPDANGGDDLEIRPSLLTVIRLKSADEEHEGGKVKTLVEARVRLSGLALGAVGVGLVAAFAGAVFGPPSLAAGATALALAGLVRLGLEVAYCGQLAYHAVEQCAEEIGLTALGKPVRAAAGDAAERGAPGSAVAAKIMLTTLPLISRSRAPR